MRRRTRRRLRCPKRMGAVLCFVNTQGEIAWDSGIYKRAGRPDSHVIEILTEQTPPEYRAYLRKQGVSYILAGKDTLDCKRAAQKLKTLFGIEKMLICGGGTVN